MSYRLQDDVKNELVRLIKSGHLERLETVEKKLVRIPRSNYIETKNWSESHKMHEH